MLNMGYFKSLPPTPSPPQEKILKKNKYSSCSEHHVWSIMGMYQDGHINQLIMVMLMTTVRLQGIKMMMPMAGAG